MITKLSHTGVWVHDQDEALAFYTDKLGFEVVTDVTVEEFGNMRWLEIGLPGSDVRVVLTAVTGSYLDAATSDQLLAILSKGYNPPLILEVEDCRATIDELRAKGVEISQEPTEQFYGVDAGIRDPSGNSLRVTQPAPAS